MTQREIQHLYLRAGFGAPLSLVMKSVRADRAALVDQLFAESGAPTMIEVVVQPTDNEMEMVRKKDLSAEEKKKIKEYARNQDKKLNMAFLKKIMSGREALNEKMTFFWHDHFACKDDNPIHAQALNNTVRKYALGDFRTLLVAVSKEPAMLKFLNNQQNKKNAPNENFAREVLELFTLGRDHYAEADIKNAARAFTGWGFDNQINGFVFRERQHDYADKTFLGTTGNLNGEDVLRIVTDQKQCSLYITDKIYRYFVNEKGNDGRVSELADAFYQSGYDIGALMRNIFSADWFYDEENIGTRIKSPIELVASIGRQFEPEFQHENILLLVQRVLGQELFSPPNVAGWPNGREWIDSSSLIFLTSLAKKIMDSAEINALPKPDDDKNPNEMLKKEKRFDLIEARIDWSKMAKELPSPAGHDMVAAVSAFLLQTNRNANMRIDVAGMSDEQKLKHICSVVTALPEYQLC
jgi:uncharacterized protein (DUF1800 family)